MADGRQDTILMANRAKPAKPKRGVAILTVLVAVAAVGGGYYWLHYPGAEKKAPPPRKIPISVATAGRLDVPIYVSGLGTVQALNTVPIHSQVDGKLVEIAFTEGQHVKKGDLLAKIDPRLFQAAYDQAVGKKGMDEANLISAEKDLARAKNLVAKSFETQQVVDQQQAKVDALKAGIKADEAAVESAATQLDYTIITSPIDGRAGIRQIDIGNIIHANDALPLVVLTQVQPTTVVFTLPEIQLEPLREAMARGPVTVTALDHNNVKQLGTGKLMLIDALIDQTTATLKLKALFPNSDERLWPGEFVNARVLLSTETNALTVPTAAVQRGPNGMFVWTIGSDEKAAMRPIKIGPPSDDVVIVTSGVKDGDRVVIEGYYKLQPGSLVAIQPPTQRAAQNTAAEERAQ
jgi:membrane fusion protein, multidrug efflux system